jgi:hypothetical protein
MSTTTRGTGRVKARFAQWASDLGLGVRLSLGGGRTSKTGVIRLILGTVGMGLAVAVLLVAASAPHAADAREMRSLAKFTDQEPRPGVDPVETGYVSTNFQGRYLSGLFLRPTGPNAPIPVGLSRLPGPDEIMVSPALADLLNSSEGALLRPRLPQRVVSVLPQEAVVDPHDLTFYAGASEPIRQYGQPSLIYGFGAEPEPFSLDSGMLLLLLVGSVVLLVPVFIFVTTSARIAGAERDRRLAALRLVGADANQVRRIAAAESLASAVTGLLLGSALFLVLRSVAENLEFFDQGVYTSDLTPTWWLGLVAILAVPVLAVLTALFALRGTLIEPLGVVRRSVPVRRRLWWRLLPFVFGPILLSARYLYGPAAEDLSIVLGVALLLIGIPLILPWLLERTVARIRGGRPSVQLAIRRLQIDSGTPARVVGGVAAVLAGAIALQTLLVSEANRFNVTAFSDDSATRPASVTVMFNGDISPKDSVISEVRRVPGVQQTHVSKVGHVAVVGEQGVEERAEEFSVTIADCDYLRQVAVIQNCADGDVFRTDQLDGAGASSTAPGPGPGDTVAFMKYSGEGQIPVSEWKLPAKLNSVALRDTEYHGVYSSFLATPAAVGGLQTGAHTEFNVYMDLNQPDVLEHVHNGLGPLHWGFYVYANGAASYNDNQQSFIAIRKGLLAGSLFTLLLAGMSLLVLALEHLRERRRAIAALAASGVPTGTLARSLLWQNAVPVLLGVVVAVATGLGLAALVSRLINNPFVVDWSVIALYSAAAAALVLTVTALTMPSLRSATRLTALRTE